MAKKRKIPGPNGQELTGSVIGFRTGVENWNEYLLDDGTVINLKLVVTEVVKVDGLTDENGDPVYVTKSQNIMNVKSMDQD